jgi:hypothetical protein
MINITLVFHHNEWTISYENNGALYNISYITPQEVEEYLDNLFTNKNIKAQVTLIAHPLLVEINNKHKYAPFTISACNFHEEKEDCTGFDFGYSSQAFGFDSGFSLERAITNCYEYAMRLEPCHESFYLNFAMDKYVKEKILPKLLKDIPEDQVQFLKDVFFVGYQLGKEHQVDHFLSLTDPENFDHNKWRIKDETKTI